MIDSIVESGPSSVDELLNFLATFPTSACDYDEAYVPDVVRMLRQSPKDFAVFRTAYALDGRAVELFDLKMKARFEDKIVSRMYAKWSAERDTVCPFRRGMCFGRFGEERFLAVGNIKFFFAPEKLLEKRPDCVFVLTEKANGEFAMFSRLSNESYGVFGSKNVRLVLPLDVEKMKKVLKNNFRQTRWSYLSEMAPSWSELSFYYDSTCAQTFIGEQLGAHKHLVEDSKHGVRRIKVFGVVDKKTLSTAKGCDVLKARKTYCEFSEFVNAERFEIGDTVALSAKLEAIKNGSREVYGEGVVLYLYDHERLVDVFKWKNEEYAFLRRVRTKLEKLCLAVKSKSRKLPSLLNDLKLTSVNDSQLEVVSSIPKCVEVMKKFQNTPLVDNFNDFFLDVLKLSERMEEPIVVEDALDNEFSKALETCSSRARRVSVRPVDDLANEFLSKLPEDSKLIGLGGPPGSGKSAVTKAMVSILEKRGSRVAFFERDKYALDMPRARPNKVHNAWLADIKAALLSDSYDKVFVGNCFAGGYSRRFVKQLDIDSYINEMTFCMFEELESFESAFSNKARQRYGSGLKNPKKNAGVVVDLKKTYDFACVCLERLSKRTASSTDGSTLTMQLGARTVLKKFFSSHVDSESRKRAIKVPMLSLPTNDFPEFEIADRLCGLKAAATTAAAPDVESNCDYVTKGYWGNPTYLPFGRGAPVPPGVRSLALVPATAESMLALLSSVDDELYRTDAHVTFAFNPSTELLEKASQQFEVDSKFVLDFEPIKTCVSRPGETAKKSGQKRLKPRDDRVQFLTVATAISREPFEDSVPLHLTLGTSDCRRLPASTCAHVLSGENLDFEVSVHESPASPPIGVEFVLKARILEEEASS